MGREINDILKDLTNLEVSLNDIMSGKTPSEDKKEITDNLLKEENEKLKEENESLKKDLEDLKAACKNMLTEFDKVNTLLREEKEAHEKSEVARKELYNQCGQLIKEREAYAKAIGNIHGSLELLDKELK